MGFHAGEVEIIIVEISFCVTEQLKGHLFRKPYPMPKCKSDDLSVFLLI